MQHDTYLSADDSFVGKVYVDLNSLLTRAEGEDLKDLVIQAST